MPAPVLAVIGGVEAFWGAHVLLFPTQTLTCTVGRLLSVDAAATSPALVPSLAQVGALRLALGGLILAVAVSAASPDEVLTFETAVVAHACVLQPFAATCRSHPRLPAGSALLLSVLEGGVIVVGMASDLDFDVEALTSRPIFLTTLGCFAAGLLLALLLLAKQCCPLASKVGDEKASGGATPLLLDESRFQLSPTSKRLLV